MITRGLVFGAIGFAVAYYLERQLATGLGDMRRYDRLRAMSGEQPFLKEQFGHVADVLTSMLGQQTSSKGFLGSIAADIVRYAKLTTM